MNGKAFKSEDKQLLLEQKTQENTEGKDLKGEMIQPEQ